MSTLPLIDNELTTIYHRNKKNIRIEFTALDHKEIKTETKSMKSIKIVEYSCVHRPNMPIITNIEIFPLFKYQNQSYYETIIFLISCRLKHMFEIYITILLLLFNTNYRNKIKMFLLLLFWFFFTLKLF